MKLNELLAFNEIVIQAHDFPDADAIASGFALYCYLRENGKKPEFIYSGAKMITKPNLRIMTEKLSIPIKYTEDIGHKPELLITVDCTYGEKNVSRFDADNIAVIDHHECSLKLPPLSEVRSNYGSCSSVVYKMLAEEGFDINSDKTVATALYYGLYTDTVALSEIHHPADMDLRDNAKPDQALIKQMSNSNLTIEEMSVAGDALKNCRYLKEYNAAAAGAASCDPNILGIISDMLLQVDSVDSCVVYCPVPNGYKLSVRSCVNTINAADYAAFITEGVGNGGGHSDKAGGFIGAEHFREENEFSSYLLGKIKEYHTDIDSFRAGEDHIDTSGMKRYIKKDTVVGFVLSTDIFKPGDDIFIRMLEGDTVIKASDDVYVMIGIEGEVYPIKRSVFEQRYAVCDQVPDPSGFEYVPVITNLKADSGTPLMPYMNGCTATGGAVILAEKLTKCAKVYTDWKENGYLFGRPGDYIACNALDNTDFYIIKGGIFDKSYDPLPAEGLA